MATKGKRTKTSLKEQSSPATTYLLSVLEKKTREETYPSCAGDVNRVTNAFASLSEILPHCGVYSPVLRLIKEELYDAVYSDTFTTSQEPKDNKSTVPKIERIPYFVLLKRLQEQKDDSVELLRSKIENLRSKIQMQERMIISKDDEILNLAQNLSNVNDELKSTQKFLNETAEKTVWLENEFEDRKKVSEERENAMRSELDEVLSRKQQLQDESHTLRPYKTNYDNLKDVFDLPPDKRPRRGFRRPILATKKTQLLSSIEAASKLEQQILEVQNRTLEEYDKHLEEVKEKLSISKFSELSSDPNYFNEELQLESLSDEMSARQNNFQRLISGMVVELELIRQHREALQSELSQLEQVEMGARAVADGDQDPESTAGTIPPSSMAGGRPGSSRMMLFDDGKKNGRDSQLSLGESGLEEDNTKLTDPSTDPFNPQERVMSKYSAMIYTSVNSGKSFDEIIAAKFCISCGEKTAICPHKVTKEDMILRLPKRCTHIKVSRPLVRIGISISQQGLPQTASTLYPGRGGADTWLSTRNEQHGWDDTGDWIYEEETRQQLSLLWNDFKSKTGTEKSSLLPVSRDLSHARVISLVEQLYASVIWQDDHLLAPDQEEESLGTMKDYLYNFISERYQEDEIMPLATFDFLSGVIKYAAHDKTILVFGQVMAGLLDGSVARYVHLVADLIDIVQWHEVKDIQGFAEVMYPFLHEEDIDQFVVEYTAFSENKISKSLVMDYIIHIVTKNREPRIQDAEGKLGTIKVSIPYNMTQTEFINAMESVAPLTNERLWKKLMKESYKSSKSDVTLISQLASITAYVSLVQVMPLFKDQIIEKIEKSRELRKEEVITKLQTSSQLVPESGKLITLSAVKQLAFNVSRQRQAGTRQIHNEFEDFCWQSRPNTQDSMS